MAEKRIYYRGQGKLYAFTRVQSSGVYVPGAGVWLGNAPEFSLSMSVTKQEHRESYSGQNLVDVSYITEKTASLSATLEEFSAFNLSLCLNGLNVEKAAATARTAAYTAWEVGKTYLLNGDINVSNVAIVDSTSTALVAGTDYTLDAPRGSFVALTAQTGTVTATYDVGAYSMTNMFTQPDAEWWVRFEGYNMLDNGAPTTVDLYRVKFDPVQNLGLISAEIAQFQLAASPLADETQPVSGDMGQFGNIKVVRGV
ncbi:MAG: hypothetical protein LBR11_08180 [Deltaproteobacteria bacterium]|jgi:hypothetical protein|nr:hypothetical protein [Deltaproteobacteria bacterium]